VPQDPSLNSVILSQFFDLLSKDNDYPDKKGTELVAMSRERVLAVLGFGEI